MKFTVHSREGSQMFFTEYEEYIPFNALSSIESAGYTFRLDGEPVSISQICKQFNRNVLEATLLSSEIDEVDESEVATVEFSITRRTIICLNTNKMYKTQSAAAVELNLDPAQLSYAISNNIPYKGYRFKKVLEGK